MNGDGAKVHARLADRAAGPFVCFCCRSQVTLRRGAAKAAHFAHRPPVTCEYGQGESDEHRRAREEIFEHLSRCTHVTKLELERDLREVRPDVSCYIGGVPVAVEVQASSLSVERIAQRTAEARGRTKDYRRLTRRVVPLPGAEADLARDFKRCNSEGWRGAGQTFPRMRLIVDTQPRWYWEGGVNWLRR